MTFTERVIGAARLDVPTYEEIEHDRTATPQALGVVVLSTLAGGIGNVQSDALGPSVAGGIFGALVGWLICCLLYTSPSPRDS